MLTGWMVGYCLIGRIMAIRRGVVKMAFTTGMNSTGETIFMVLTAINPDSEPLETLMDSCFQEAVSKFWTVSMRLGGFLHDFCQTPG